MRHRPENPHKVKNGVGKKSKKKKKSIAPSNSRKAEKQKHGAKQSRAFIVSSSISLFRDLRKISIRGDCENHSELGVRVNLAQQRYHGDSAARRYTRPGLDRA